MSLVPKEILLSHLQRAEGAKEVTLPIDFFRDLLYQAMPRTWVGLTDEEIEQGCKESWVTLQAWQSGVWWAEAKLKEKNNEKGG